MATSASASTSKMAAKKPSTRGGFSLGRAISKCLLFSCGPFYCYPWKPLINEVAGVSYEVANKHFWAQHKDTYNLLWHVVCMFFQVWSNLSFLARIEGPLAAAVGVDLGTKVHGHRMLPLLCVTLWGLVLLIPRKGSDCPFLAKTLSLLTLGLAYNTAHHFTGQVMTSLRICTGLHLQPRILWCQQCPLRTRRRRQHQGRQRHRRPPLHRHPWHPPPHHLRHRRLGRRPVIVTLGPLIRAPVLVLVRA
jgi:hypothetical protein